MSEIRDKVEQKMREVLEKQLVVHYEINEILSIPELAIVDREVELPTLVIEWDKMPFLSGVIANNMRQAINEVIVLKVENLFKTGWVKEEINNEKS